MSAPEVIEQPISGTPTWFVVSAIFPTAELARSEWERIERELKMGSIGMYRHGREGAEGNMITAVSMKRPEVERVARYLNRHGEQNDLSQDERHVFIARRAKVVLAALNEGHTSGRLTWRRPEGRGAIFDPNTGEMREREPGRG